MLRVCQTPKKSIEIDNSKHDSTGFATKIRSISHQPPAGSANVQFDKTEFFLDTLYISMQFVKECDKKLICYLCFIYPSILLIFNTVTVTVTVAEQLKFHPVVRVQVSVEKFIQHKLK